MRAISIGLMLLAVACGKEEEPPPYTHIEPDEANAQTCVLCHSCGTDGTGVFSILAPIPKKSHGTCNMCHEQDPVVHNCDVNCDWQKECDDNPDPIANCSQCHASGVPKKTITEINDECRQCHAAKPPLTTP